MFAIVTIAGQQFKVRSGEEIFVHRLAGNVGDKLNFTEVLMTGNDNQIKAGKTLSASVEAEILDHLKGDKVIVFKKKRRKGYQKSNGHRQCLTRIRIGAIA
jgi:large subunit ribosomal protein L21